MASSRFATRFTFASFASAMLAWLLLSTSASASVVYEWIGSKSNQGYGANIRMSIVLPAQGYYSETVESCTVLSDPPCGPLPASALISFTLSGADFVYLEPRVGQAPFSWWDLDVFSQGANLHGSIWLGTFYLDIRMSSNHGLWTIHHFGSDQNIPIEDDSVTGRFRRVPEPGTSWLLVLAACVCMVLRRRGSGLPATSCADGEASHAASR